MAFMLAVITAESTRIAGTATTEHLLAACMRHLHVATSFRAIVTTNWELRKTGHFLGYGMLGLLTARSWWRRMLPALRHTGTAVAQAMCMGVLCAATVASLDEWHQSFLPGRSASVDDVFLDTFGAGSCILLYFIFRAGKHRQAHSGAVAVRSYEVDGPLQPSAATERV